LHLFSTKVVFTRSKLYLCAHLTAKDLTQPIFVLRGLGQKQRFSELPPLVELRHCRTWLAGFEKRLACKPTLSL